jgi:hypothetical protein
VRILGNKKAIELLMETAEVEQNGGLFIMVRLFLLFLLLYYHLAFFFFFKAKRTCLSVPRAPLPLSQIHSPFDDRVHSLCARLQLSTDLGYLISAGVAGMCHYASYRFNFKTVV